MYLFMIKYRFWYSVFIIRTALSFKVMLFIVVIEICHKVLSDSLFILFDLILIDQRVVYDILSEPLNIPLCMV